MRLRLRGALRLIAALALLAPARGVFAESPGAPEPAQPAPAPAPATTPPEPGTPAAPATEPVKRVVYLPETVKQELIAQIRKEVLEQAKAEGWAAPNVVAAWVQKMRVGGDVRGRFERILFPRGNANGGEFPDFNAINNGNPFDANFVDFANERYLDVDQNRTRPRLRARLGVESEIGGGFSALLRLGSGDSSSPVTTNQTLGATGAFSKLPVWLDRAALAWEAFAEPGPAQQRRHLSVELGRFENPFFTTEMLFAKDVNFDGAAVRADLLLGASPTRLFLTGGAFPLQITSLSFPAERPDKFRSRNKWLYGAQAGAESQVGFLKLKGAAGFFDFSNVEGRASSPCDTNLKGVSCDTDNTRPGYAQQGNTYLALRTPSEAALALEGSSTVPEYQYYGLASRFRELTASLGAEVKLAGNLKVTLEGELCHNAGFKRREVAPVAKNNRGPSQAGDPFGPYLGGANAGFGRIAFASASQNRPLDWRFGVSYRYVQSDSLLDALDDADFGLGGTNLKGYTLEGLLGVAPDVQLVARWFSADAIVGPRYSADVFQVDLQARF